jgi:hypothetical protein
MSILTSVWHELVRRRLLPVAILLLAALVAIPFVLGKDPEPAAAPPQATHPSEATAAAGDPIVSLVEDGDRTKRRRVLGARKNPFEPAPVKPVKTPAPASTTVTTTQPSPPSQPATSGGTASASVSTGGGSTPASSGPSAPAVTPPASTAPATPKAPTRRYELYSLVVRFGDSTADSLEKSTLPRLKPLPDAKDPVLVYLGLSKDEKSAIFLLDAGVNAQGDGTCAPSVADCQTIALREGDTEFLDVLDDKGQVSKQYELDLVRIRRSTTASAARASAARAAASKVGRRILRAREAKLGPLHWRYDARKGVVVKRSKKAFKAAVARAGMEMAGFAAQP